MIARDWSGEAVDQQSQNTTVKNCVVISWWDGDDVNAQLFSWGGASVLCCVMLSRRDDIDIEREFSFQLIYFSLIIYLLFFD